jgi:signal transduction histidine kinase
MIAFAAVVLLSALVAGFAATAVVMRMHSIRARTIGALLVTAALPLLAMLASGLIMFESEHDVVVMAVVVGTTLVALGAAILLLRGIARPIDSLNATAHEIAAGDLAARAPKTGISETDELADSFNTMADSVESLFDARRQLVVWASHDLRTPLASIRAMLEAIEDGVSTPEEYLPGLQQQTSRLSQLIDDLFELAMIDAAALSLEYDEVRVGDLVSSCVTGFAHEADAAGVRLTTRIESPERTVYCAPDKIERVVMNLLVNALRHTPSDGAVAVTADYVDDLLRVTVDDDGEGLDGEAKAHAFDQFFRGDAARSEPGAGLGLAIARGLIEAHGGSISAANNAAGGASFSFTVPIAGPHRETAAV